MSTSVTLIASLPNFVPIALGWLTGVLLIVGLFLYNRSRIKAQERD